jgi:transcriptional regulator with XRE-family HTH domain
MNVISRLDWPKNPESIEKQIDLRRSIVQLSEQKTNEIVYRLEEMRFGKQLSEEELAQKADVPLDYVNRLETQQRIEDREGAERLAKTLGITSALLEKIMGVEQITHEELQHLENCLARPGSRQAGAVCQRIGLKNMR